MKIIEFTGTPKSGKTALIKKLMGDLVAHSKASILSQGFRNCPFKDIKGVVYDQQVWTLFAIVNKILEEKNALNRPEFLILDRGIWDRKVFIKYFYDRKEITDDQYKQLNYIVDTYTPLIDIVFNITTTPELSIKRQIESGTTSRFSKDELLVINALSMDIVSPIAVNLEGRETLDNLFDTIVSSLQIS